MINTNHNLYRVFPPTYNHIHTIELLNRPVVKLQTFLAAAVNQVTVHRHQVKPVAMWPHRGFTSKLTNSQ